MDCHINNKHFCGFVAEKQKKTGDLCITNAAPTDMKKCKQANAGK